MSYQYHAMSNFFNRDNVGLQGFAAFYRVSSLEERAHAQQLMDYQVQPANAPFVSQSKPADQGTQETQSRPAQEHSHMEKAMVLIGIGRCASCKEQNDAAMRCCVAPELCLKISASQATRGGRVKLAALAAPPPDYNHEQKGDALYSMEIALALEKLNFQMLYSLHETADKAGDAQMTDFVEEMLAEQVCLD